jgi:DNA-binding transcriptional ArsR family regulator
MIETLLGSPSRERALIFLVARSEGYPREIARYFDVDLAPIQNQLEKLESGGILFSRLVGRTRLYAFNPRYPFLKELLALLLKVLSFYPAEEQDKLIKNRRRPRRKGKPL